MLSCHPHGRSTCYKIQKATCWLEQLPVCLVCSLAQTNHRAGPTCPRQLCCPSGGTDTHMHIPTYSLRIGMRFRGSCWKVIADNCASSYCAPQCHWGLMKNRACMLIGPRVWPVLISFAGRKRDREERRYGQNRRELNKEIIHFQNSMEVKVKE